MKFGSLRALLNGAIALVLAACGGGGDGGIGGTGVAGNDISIGGITAFGSVWVNGVRFNSDDATVKRDDDPVTHDANNPLNRRGGLRQGMVARVKGSISGAKADEIRVDSAAKGWVQSVTGNQMVVMGQTVVIDASTVIEDNVRPQQGDFAEVHGLVTSDGTISATFVERKTAPTPLTFAVKGFVKGHLAGGTTFQVGALNVTLATGAVTNDMPAGSWSGILVEVKGNACTGNPICGTLTATKVEPNTPRGDVAQIEVEGVVTSGNSAAFNIGSQVVDASSATFVDGAAIDLVVGTKVEVEGSLVGGMLKATKVSFRENVRFDANVASVSGNSFTLQGLAGITIEANNLTRFDKVADVAGLTQNNNVRVRARPGNGGTVVATEVELRSQTANLNDVRFRAIVTAATDPNLTMLGLPISTASVSEFRDLTDQLINRSQFFATVNAGNKLVQVRGSQSGATITWNRAELED